MAKPTQAASLFDWFRETFGVDKNVEETLTGQIEADKGKMSLHSLVPSVSKVGEADWFLKLNGVPADSVAVQNMTDEEKAIVYEHYGRGVIGDTTQALAMLYTPPASGTTYVAELLENAHIIPQAQAQGLGFSSLDPVLETWKVFRNIAYFFFVVIFLMIGFMIMFRQKLNGQTVVTAQQAIPGIIISLIFVTFSYAIAGFLIDLMYLLMYLMIGLFSPEGGTELISKTFLQIGWDVVTGVNTNGAFSSMNEAVKTFAASIDTSAVGDVLGWLGGLTMGLIVSIAILIGVFKLFFELLKIYITIIVAIVVSPLLLMMGAVPGKSNFGYWIKIVFGNLLAFPMVLFSLILYEMFTKGDLSVGGFMPPFLIGRGSGSVMMTLVGIGIILIIPELIKEMKKAMKIDGGIWETLAFKAVDQTKEGVPLGSRVAGATFGAGAGAIGGGLGATVQSWRAGNRGMDLVRDIGRGAGRGAGNTMAKGTQVGGWLADKVGAKTPAMLSGVETIVDRGGQHFSDAERLKRIAGDQDFLGRDATQRGSYEEKEKMAKRKRDRMRAETYGEEDKH